MERFKQCNNILQSPHITGERLSEKNKPRLNFPQATICNLAVIVTE